MAFKQAPASKVAEDDGGGTGIVEMARSLVPEGTDPMALAAHGMMAALALAIILAVRRIFRIRARQRALERMAEELDARLAAREGR